MEIYIITKNVYGNDLFYVKAPNQASVLRRLTGRKTVSRLDIDMLVRLDVKVRVSEEAQDALGWTAEEAGTAGVNQADLEAWKRGKLAHFAKTAKKATEARWEAYNKSGGDFFGTRA